MSEVVGQHRIDDLVFTEDCLACNSGRHLEGEECECCGWVVEYFADEVAL